MDTSPPRAYSPVNIAFHWLMVLLIVALYACIDLHEQFPKGSAIRAGLKTSHFMLGLTVFVLVWLRLVARLGRPRPPIVPEPPAWEEAVAKLMYLVLYLFMIAMPLLGWLALSAKGDPIPFFGLTLPPLIAQDKALGKQIQEVHETIGTIGYFLVGLHAAAALFHHYIQRDNTLRRMLPRRQEANGQLRTRIK